MNRKYNKIPTTIYALTAEGAGDLDGPMYIGATTQYVEVRRAQHIVNAFSKRHGWQDMPGWVRGVLEAGGKLTITPIEIVPAGGDWEEAERFHIAYWRAQGVKLMNVSDGGLTPLWGARAPGWVDNPPDEDWPTYRSAADRF